MTSIREINERLLGDFHPAYKAAAEKRIRAATLDQAVRNVTGPNMRDDLEEALAMGIYLQAHEPTMYRIRAEYARLSGGGNN